MRWKYLFIFDNWNFLVEDQGILQSFKFIIHVHFTYSSYNWFYVIEWYFFFYLSKGRWLLNQSFLVIVVEKIYLSKHISLKLIEARSILDVLCASECACSLTQSCLGPTLCGPMEHTRLLCPWDFPVRILERVASFSSRGSSQPRDWTWESLFSFVTIPWCELR